MCCGLRLLVEKPSNQSRVADNEDGTANYRHRLLVIAPERAWFQLNVRLDDSP